MSKKNPKSQKRSSSRKKSIQVQLVILALISEYNKAQNVKQVNAHEGGNPGRTTYNPKLDRQIEFARYDVAANPQSLSDEPLSGLYMRRPNQVFVCVDGRIFIYTFEQDLEHPFWIHPPQDPGNYNEKFDSRKSYSIYKEAGYDKLLMSHITKTGILTTANIMVVEKQNYGQRKPLQADKTFQVRYNYGANSISTFQRNSWDQGSIGVRIDKKVIRARIDDAGAQSGVSDSLNCVERQEMVFPDIRRGETGLRDVIKYPIAFRKCQTKIYAHDPSQESMPQLEGGMLEDGGLSPMRSTRIGLIGAMFNTVLAGKKSGGVLYAFTYDFRLKTLTETAFLKQTTSTIGLRYVGGRHFPFSKFAIWLRQHGTNGNYRLRVLLLELTDKPHLKELIVRHVFYHEIGLVYEVNLDWNEFMFEKVNLQGVFITNARKHLYAFRINQNTIRSPTCKPDIEYKLANDVTPTFTHICMPCQNLHSECHKCEMFSPKCKECFNNFKPEEDGTGCVCDETKGYAIDAEGQCLCDATKGYKPYQGGGCKRCSDEVPNCKECDFKFLCSLCEDGFYRRSDTLCLPCSSIDDRCTSCSQDGRCLACSGGVTPNAGGQSCGCEVGQLQRGPNCVPCAVLDPRCTQCSSDGTQGEICSDCKAPMVVDPENSQKCGCAVGFYHDDGACTACSQSITNCEACSNYFTCTQCSGHLIFDSNKDTCGCEKGRFQVGTECRECETEIQGCVACQGNTISSTLVVTCDECFGANQVVFSPPTGPRKCVFNCKTEGLVFNPDGSCLDCRPYQTKAGLCDDCSEEKGCKRCKNNQLLVYKNDKDQVVCTHCEQGYVFVEDPGVCIPCYKEPERRCTKCQPSVKNMDSFVECLECDPNYDFRSGDAVDSTHIQCRRPPADNECYDGDQSSQEYTRCDLKEEFCAKCLRGPRNRCQRFGTGAMVCAACEPSDQFKPALPGSKSRFRCLIRCQTTEISTPNNRDCRPCSDIIQGCSECSKEELRSSAPPTPPPPGAPGFVAAQFNKILNSQTNEDKSEVVQYTYTCTKCRVQDYTLRAEFVSNSAIPVEMIPPAPSQTLRSFNYQCIKKCLLGTVLTPQNRCKACGEEHNNQGVCTACSYTKSAPKFKCTACKAGLTLYKAPESPNQPPGVSFPYCHKRCPEGTTFSLPGKCSSCRTPTNKHCSACQFLDHTVCTACEKGYFLNPFGFCQKKCLENEAWIPENSCFRCRRLTENCSKCQNSTRGCVACEAGYRFMYKGGKPLCQPICGKNFGYDPEANQCVLCGERHEYCSECGPGPVFQCSKCRENEAFLNKEHNCQKKCSGLQAWTKPNNCVDCKENCLRCANRTLECTQCDENHVLVKTTLRGVFCT